MTACYGFVNFYHSFLLNGIFKFSEIFLPGLYKFTSFNVDKWSIHFVSKKYYALMLKEIN